MSKYVYLITAVGIFFAIYLGCLGIMVNTSKHSINNCSGSILIGFNEGLDGAECMDLNKKIIVKEGKVEILCREELKVKQKTLKGLSDRQFFRPRQGPYLLPGAD